MLGKNTIGMGMMRKDAFVEDAFAERTQGARTGKGTSSTRADKSCKLNRALAPEVHFCSRL